MTTQISGDSGVSQCQPNSVSQDDLVANVVGKGPAFAATSTGQSVSAGVYTKVNFTAVEFDKTNSFDVGTDRFQPLVAGYYLISAELVAGGNGANTVASVDIRLNGATFAPIKSASLLSGFTPTVSRTTLLYLNGTTDYVEVWGRDTVQSSLGAGRFSGFLARAA